MILHIFMYVLLYSLFILSSDRQKPQVKVHSLRKVIQFDHKMSMQNIKHSVMFKIYLKF